MLLELVVRFIVGGLVITAFAVLGDLMQPKSFAGIFGAAPSVALATLGLTFAMKGGSYVGLEGRSMVAGAVALCLYSLLVGWLLLRERRHALLSAGGSWLLWFGVTFVAWGMVLR